MPANLFIDVPIPLSDQENIGEVVEQLDEAASYESLDQITTEIIAEGVPRAFPSPGSKVKLAAFFIANMPEHDTFVEPFVGGGSVFFRRDFPVKKEVINDLDTEVVTFYKELQKDPAGLVAYLRGKSFAFSQARFQQIKNWKPLRSKDIAYKHIYLVWRSYGNTKLRPRANWKNRPFNHLRWLDNLIKTGERLKDVEITREDGLACIKRWDSPTTFFYIDPPYPGPGKSLFKEGNFSYSPEEFTTTLKALRGKFILSLDDTPENRAMLKGLFVYQLITPYSRLALLKGYSNAFSELIASNYRLPHIRTRPGKSITSVHAISTSAKEAMTQKESVLRGRIANQYVVTSDLVLPSRIQYHIRDILIGKELLQCQQALQKDRDAAWDNYRLFTLRGSLEELRQDMQRADDSDGDVSGAMEAFLNHSPTDVALDQLYTLGSVHADWRKPHPSMNFLSSSWTMMVQKTCLQRVSDGEVLYLLKDKALESQGDSFLSQQKCCSVTDPDENNLLPVIVAQRPDLLNESFLFPMDLPPELWREVFDSWSLATAGDLICEAIQPLIWLNLVTSQRRIVDVPARVSSEEEDDDYDTSAARFIWVADTRMVYGVQKTDYHEYFHFFDAMNDDLRHAPPETLSGRWNWALIRGQLSSAVRTSTGDFWLGSKPQEQRPYILTHNRQEEEDKAAREKIKMVWNEKALDLLQELGHRHLK